jgi:exo-1,4-beta-D-glucosaminidase
MTQEHVARLRLNLCTKYPSAVLLVSFIFIALTVRALRQPESSALLLHHGWSIQSSCDVKATGQEISTVGFSTKGWHRAEVPTTVVAALLADKTYPDPFFGKNLKSFPGMNYNTAEFFANQPMPADSPFRCSWWYRTEFNLPVSQQNKAQWLHFDGLNYRANIWVNGQKIADAQEVAGTFRTFEFNVTKQVVAGKPNILAVEVFAPDKGDLGITWVDWNPTPADKDMGLWKPVYLTSSGEISLHVPFVSAKLGSDYATAALTVSAVLRNVSDHSVTGKLQATIEGITVSQSVELVAGETKAFTFDPGRYAQLKLNHPRLWWPYQMGTPELYTARLSVGTNGHASDSAEVHFGVREVTSELTSQGHRLFKINGRNLLVRGAAWAPDMFLRWSPEQAAASLQYVRAMNLNTIRFEGRMERDEYFDMADRWGILIMPGWTCCDAWEKWEQWTPEQMTIAGESLGDQITRLRNHPSVFVWLYGSDNPPPANVEAMYLQILKDKNWPNPSVSSASATPTSITGPSGVKMTGPYDYVPPNYWLMDTTAGGAYGYNTETSPGPVIPTLESLKRFIPSDHLWPIDDYWNYHSGGERFATIDKFINGLEQRYGKAATLQDFLRKSQAMNYEAERAMFEAYGRNKYTSTGVIQWMLNNAWPSLIWHLYDYYLVPSGAYFGTKKSCEPLHVQYSYDDNSVTIVNGDAKGFSALTVKATIYDIDAKERASQDKTLDVPADSSVRALQLPKPENISTTYFLKLELKKSGKVLSENFYWLSTKPDVVDWANKQDTVYTPQSAYADLTGLSSLKPVRLIVHSTQSREGKEQVVRAWVQNPSTNLALMVHLRLARGKSGEDVVPIFWDDNYFSLLPGEKREASARFDVIKSGANLILKVDGWNVTPGSVAPATK